MKDEKEDKKIEKEVVLDQPKKKHTGLIVGICFGTVITILLVVIIILLLTQGGTKSSNDNDDSKSSNNTNNSEQNNNYSNQGNDVKHQEVEVKTSTDKHIQYIKDYVSKNAASIGYESLGGEKRDHYGAASVELVFVNSEGSYIGVSKENLKDYVVIDQNYEPNSELKIVFDKDPSGNEYSNLTDWQSINTIILRVKKVGENNPKFDNNLVRPLIPNDKYEDYVKDYVGLNLANCGYLSLGGELRDHYGDASVALKIQTNDGSYIDVNESEALKDYKVVSQDVEPNTKISMVYAKSSDGKEYSWTESQSVEQIYLSVEKIK